MNTTPQTCLLFGRVCGASLLAAALAFAACRNVSVGSGDSGEPPTDLIDGIDQKDPTTDAGAGGVGGAAGAGGAAGMGGSTTPAGSGGAAASTSIITGIEVLYQPLNAIHVPAVGSERVSLLQYTATGTAMVLHVTWAGAAGRWHESSGASHIYAAASGTRHVNLLYTSGYSSYGIYENGGATELSGTPATYKEFLTAGSQGFAWVDYGTITGGGGSGSGTSGGSGGPGPGGMLGDGSVTTTSLGTITLETWAGARTELTDGLRYRARVALSETHIAYVEYASTAPGTVGQIMVQALSGGAAFAAAPSALHQDRPAVNGDWVVWEEYVGSTDSVIRARNLVSGEVRDVSARVGFRTNPDVREDRVVWEDQRSGNGDIYACNLSDAIGERVAVSGVGHSSGARLTADGLVWIEANGNNMGLLRARWR